MVSGHVILRGEEGYFFFFVPSVMLEHDEGLALLELFHLSKPGCSK